MWFLCTLSAGNMTPLKLLKVRIFQKVSFIMAHCSYLEIYISLKIRLCLVDFEGKFQTNLQAKLFNFLVWKFKSIMVIFLLFLQNLSNRVLCTHCCCYSKELTSWNCNLMQKLQFQYVNSLE